MNISKNLGTPQTHSSSPKLELNTEQSTKKNVDGPVDTVELSSVKSEATESRSYLPSRNAYFGSGQLNYGSDWSFSESSPAAEAPKPEAKKAEQSQEYLPSRNAYFGSGQLGYGSDWSF